MNDLEKRKQKADEEYQEVLKWALLEEDKVYEKLKTDGKLRQGLDGNSKDFEYIYAKVESRIKEIVSKYDLPNKAEWV